MLIEGSLIEDNFFFNDKHKVECKNNIGIGTK